MCVGSSFRGKVTVKMDGKRKEVFIDGRLNLNRAFEGDQVAIEILETAHHSHLAAVDVDETSTGLTESHDASVERTLLTEDFLADGQTLEVSNSISSTATAVNGAAMDVDSSDELRGRVVAIVKKGLRQFTGSLRPIGSAAVEGDEDDVGHYTYTKEDRIFVPTDPRVPFIRLTTKHSADLEGMRIIVSVDGWERSSRMPHGHWTTVLGKAGDKETEHDVILFEHGVITRDFSPAVLACLPREGKSYLPITDKKVISQLANGERMDLREVLNGKLCSIDPPGCKDIDDALSIEGPFTAPGQIPPLPGCNKSTNPKSLYVVPKNKPGIGIYPGSSPSSSSSNNYHHLYFRVGVHIADVTHFLEDGSVMDKEARERCTTVYLVTRRTDMLPSLLTTNLCSLVGNADRLAFSVFWDIEITVPSGNKSLKNFTDLPAHGTEISIMRTIVSKSIIKSSAALTYSAAQLLLDSAGKGFAEAARKIAETKFLKKIEDLKRDESTKVVDIVTEVEKPDQSAAVMPGREDTTEGRDTLLLDSVISSGNSESLSSAVFWLWQITSVLRRKRIECGAIELASSEVKFEIINESVRGVREYDSLNTNKLVEELMLLANQVIKSR
jgi:exosome complex exonuclease DIS3/RRP44